MPIALHRQFEAILARIEKPARYLGTEHGAVHKDLSTVRLHVALAFPEVYEIAQSHLGLQLLYRILNRRSEFYAERVYAPWLDMEAELRRHQLPLSSLETTTPLRDFDIVGFSLQYELTYTNVLAMLDLGGIRLRSHERNSSDPLVIAGGPCTFNPEPMAPFFDALLVGDGEEAILDICNACLSWGRGDRRELLQRLSEIVGVYVPSLRSSSLPSSGASRPRKAAQLETTLVHKRVLTDLESSPAEPRQIVPLVKAVHDRANVEVMRGCVKGCRFCQAGYVYRPLRERDPATLLTHANNLVGNTGFDELSLLSLSTGDYSCLEGLLASMADSMSSSRVATSLPSTRVDALSPQIIREIRRVRKTGFTLAPEAGTERLRGVIQKAYTEEQLLNAAERLFALGWRNLKLYFMIGLPTETATDLRGIVELCTRLQRLSRGRGQITASASTFVPKPHTPFQWVQQIGLDETRERQAFLKQELAAKRIRFKWHDPAQSYLEGILARGDQSLANTVERAFALGCRFDGWTEKLKADLWRQAMAETSIDPNLYLGARDLDMPLPWDHIDSGVSKAFLRREWDAALHSRHTPDCALEQCAACGVCDFRRVRNIIYRDNGAKGTECRGGRDLTENKTIELPRTGDQLCSADPPPPPPFAHPASCRIRLCHLKLGWSRFLGNLDLVAVMLRALRRSKLPIAFSAGHHPAPRLSPGPALALGIESNCEMLDLWMTRELPPEQVLRAMNQELPAELRMTSAARVPLKAPSIDSDIVAFVYQADLKGIFPNGGAEQVIDRLVHAFSQAQNWPLDKTVRGITKSVDAKELAQLRHGGETKLVLETRFSPAGALKPTLVLASVLGLETGDLSDARIRKVETVLGRAAASAKRESNAAVG